jgi:O-antigen/teichoic acid export membrane protein
VYKRLFRSSVGLIISQIFIKGIAFFYTIFLARTLNVDNFGFYTASLAFFALVTSFGEFGFNRYLIREGTKDHTKLPTLIATVAVTRSIFSIVSIAVIGLLLLIFDDNPTRIYLTFLALMAVLPHSIALTYDAALVAKEQFRYSAYASIILSVTNAVIGYFLVFGGLGAEGALFALMIAQAIYLVVLILFVKQNNINLWSSLSRSMAKQIISGTIPYGVLGILGLLYFRVDTLLLSYLKGSYDTGIYGAAYKFIEAIVFIPSVIFTTLFPTFAKLHDSDKSTLKDMYYRSLKMMMGLSVVILAGYLLVLPLVFKMALPQYVGSRDALFLLSFSIPCMFFNAPAVIVLFATDKYLKPVIVLSIFTVLFNIVGNILLIPTYGYMAAAAMTVTSELLSCVVFYVLLVKRVFK